MNSGPRPSEACVDAGAGPRSWNSPLPTWKRWRPSNVMLAEGAKDIGVEQLLDRRGATCMVSNDSAAEKSAVGAPMMACTRARSSADRSVRPGAGDAGAMRQRRQYND